MSEQQEKDGATRAAKWALSQMRAGRIRSTGVLATLLTLAAYCNRSYVCWPKVDTLAADTGRSRRAVQNDLAELERAGLLSREIRQGVATRYRLPVPPIGVNYSASNVSHSSPSEGSEGCSTHHPGVKSSTEKGCSVLHPEEPVEEPLEDVDGFALEEPPPNGRPKKQRRRKPEIPLPDDWKPKPRHQKKAEEFKVSLSGEVMKFRTNAAMKDLRWRDWDAAFDSWLIKAKEFAERDAQRYGRDASTEDPHEVKKRKQRAEEHERRLKGEMTFGEIVEFKRQFRGREDRDPTDEEITTEQQRRARIYAEVLEEQRQEGSHHA